MMKDNIKSGYTFLNICSFGRKVAIVIPPPPADLHDITRQSMDAANNMV